MTDPIDPYNPAPDGVNDPTLSGYGNAPSLVKLSAIFMLISAGLTGIGVLYMIFLAVFINSIFGHGGIAGPPPLPPFYLRIIYGAMAVFALVVAILKTIAGLKLLRGGTRAWAWGLTSGIVSCIELLWCSLACFLPMAAGIFTIVILCKPNVQAYLRERPAGPTPHPDGDVPINPNDPPFYP